MRRRMTGFLAASLLVTLAVAALLASTAALAFPDAALTAVLLVLMPTLGLAQVPLANVEEIERIAAYASSALTIAALSALCWAVGTRSAGPRALGFVSLPVGSFALWTVALAAAGLAVLGAFRWASGLLGWSESPFLRALLPRTTRERWTFGLLSLVAGLGEEIVYRGYAIPVLARPLGSAGAAALTSAVFGVLHAYQGAVGVVRTAVLGGLLAWGFLAAGSLWPAVAAHAVIDVLAGVVLAERLAGR